MPFRFYHPEFSQMPGCIGIFRPEGGTKSIYLREPMDASSPSSWPLTARFVALPKKSSLKFTNPAHRGVYYQKAA
jgi:hypothetical protein